MNPSMVGKVLDYQAKQICFNVYTYFKKRKLDRTTQEYQDDINLINIVSEVTGLSKSTVSRIARDGSKLIEETGSAIFNQEKKKHVRKKRIAVDKFTEGIIRRKVIQFYTVKKEVPSIRRLNQLLKDENILSCSNEYLRQLLHKLGFTNSETGESKGMILERPDIVTERFNYLQAILEYRAQNRSIFFLNETRRSLSSENETAINVSNMKKMPSIIIVHASGGVGFKDGSLIMLKPIPRRNYEKDITFEHFDNYDWIMDHVMLNLTPSSVIVTNIPYCETSTSGKKEPRPITSSNRGVMQEWLDRHRIPYRATDSKSDLLQLINNEKKTKDYNITKVLEENGHAVLNLPQNHPDLNPVIMAWEELKNELEGTAPIKLFSKYSTEDWGKCFDRVKKNESEYYEHDTKLDEAVSSLVNVKREHNSDGEEEDNLNSDCDEMELEFLL